MPMVTQPAIFHPCEFSYLGAIAGVLQARGIPCDIVDVGGYSGYAFLTKATEGWTDPGSVSMHSGNVDAVPEAVQQIWADFRAGTELLGAQLAAFWDTRQLAFWDASQQAGNTERTHALFERVKQAIDGDCPAIVWGLGAPEYGIVNGYAGDSYIVSTFRGLIGQADDPVRYDQLEAKGGLELIVVRGSRPSRTEADDRATLVRATTMAEGSPYRFAFETPRHPLGRRQRYVTGVAAFDAWAEVLERYVPDTIYPEYMSYLAACTLETKQVAAQFLTRLATRYPDRPFTPSLQQAAGAYEQAAAELEQLVWIFMYGDPTPLSSERCLRGAAHLRAAQPHEQRALDHLREAQHTWA
jgi:hypothetical protein